MRKKYTVVLPIDLAGGEEVARVTIAHIGSKNFTSPGRTLNLFDCNPDGLLTNDMNSYQFFKICGCAYSVIYPEGTIPDATPVQWSLAYSSSLVMNADITFGQMQSLQTYQTGGCHPLRPTRRYFRTGTTLRRLGVEWAPTTELPDYSAANILYGGQLPVNQGSSSVLKIYRNNQALDTDQ